MNAFEDNGESMKRWKLENGPNPNKHKGVLEGEFQVLLWVNRYTIEVALINYNTSCVKSNRRQ